MKTPKKQTPPYGVWLSILSRRPSLKLSCRPGGILIDSAKITTTPQTTKWFAELFFTRVLFAAVCTVIRTLSAARYWRSLFLVIVIFLQISCCSFILDVVCYTRNKRKQTTQQSNYLRSRTKDRFGQKTTVDIPYSLPLQYGYFHNPYLSI